MRCLQVVLRLVWLGCGMALAGEAAAQRVPIPPRAPAAPTPAQSPRLQQRGAPRQVEKPFTHLYRTPTISPYLNLTRDDDLRGGLPNYFALVRPQLQQQEINRQQQRSLDRLGHELQAVEARVALPPGGNPELRPTGHAVYFQNYSHYYRR